jgi:Pyruvate/2-oxoacid:ferredoxin oxidoreductase gamma subunit
LDQNYTIEDLNTSFIPYRDAHLVIGLDPFQTFRKLHYLSEKTVVILNTHKVYSDNVNYYMKSEKNISQNIDIINIIEQIVRKTLIMDFESLSKIEFNNAFYTNIIMLGVCALEFKDIFIKKPILESIKEILGDNEVNLSAFDLGYDLIDGL